jgi:hypothetical protein
LNDQETASWSGSFAITAARVKFTKRANGERGIEMSEPENDAAKKTAVAGASLMAAGLALLIGIPCLMIAAAILFFVVAMIGR